MSRFGLVAVRIKRKKDIPFARPDNVKYFCISHVFLNGENFKVYKNGGNQFERNTELLLHNMVNGKWYKLENRKFDND